jgi:carbonic anhydrase
MKLMRAFTHRNIPNVVSYADMNFLSVLQYAVEVLGIQDIIVYGHYGCGGIRAAMENEAIGLIDNWLANIKDVMASHQAELDAISDENDRLNRLVELNVLAQIHNLKQTSVYRKAKKEGRELRLHAWVYDFSNGKVRVLEQA